MHSSSCSTLARGLSMVDKQNAGPADYDARIKAPRQKKDLDRSLFRGS